jgi:hypothetical protein
MCVLLLLFHSALEMQEGGGNVGGREGKRGDGGRRGREREGSKDCRRRTGGGDICLSLGRRYREGAVATPGVRSGGKRACNTAKYSGKMSVVLWRGRGEKIGRAITAGGGSLYSAGLILRGGESFSSLNSPTRESLSPSAELKACERASERDNNKHTHTETR